MSSTGSSCALSEEECSSSKDELDSHQRTKQANLDVTEFIQSLNDEDFDGLCFTDKLVAFTDLDEEVGESTIHVSESFYHGEPCFYVHALSHGTIYDMPSGTTVTAFVSRRLETLEQDHHEYCKLPNHPIDTKTTIRKSEEEYVINISRGRGEETTKSEQRYSAKDMEGVIAEGSNILLLRLLARKGISFERMNLISFDSHLSLLCYTSYRALHGQKENIAGKELDVVRIERNLSTALKNYVTWRYFLTNDGHLVKRLQSGSPFYMVIVALPEAAENGEKERRPVFPKEPLNWEEDMKLRSKYEDRKDELVAEHSTYMRQNPEVKALVNDFVQFLLLRKPTDVLAFAADYFEAFGRKRSVGGSYLNSQTPERHPDLISNQNIDYLSKVSYAD